MFLFSPLSAKEQLWQNATHVTGRPGKIVIYRLAKKSLPLLNVAL